MSTKKKKTATTTTTARPRTVTLKPGDVLTIKRAKPKKRAKKTVSEVTKPKKTAGKKKKKPTVTTTTEGNTTVITLPSLARDPATGAFIPKAKRVQHWMNLFTQEGLI